LPIPAVDIAGTGVEAEVPADGHHGRPALIAVQTLGGGEAGIVLDARAAGCAVAAIAVWRRAPFLVVVASGVVTAALLRALV
jgi:hypothetical protein